MDKSGKGDVTVKEAWNVLVPEERVSRINSKKIRYTDVRVELKFSDNIV
jgi:hypothetical protein